MISLKLNAQLERLIPAVGLPLAIFLFLPLIVYSTNLDEVDISTRDILTYGMAFSIFSSAALYLIFCVPKMGRASAILCQVLLLALFIKVVFPNSVGEMAGFAAQPETQEFSLDLLTSIAILAFCAAYCYFKRESFLISLRLTILIIAAYIICTPILVNTTNSDAKKLDSPSKVEVLGLGSGLNVIVVVLDAFTGYRFGEILDERPELKERFTGFEYYPRALAVAGNSPAGISNILTGDYTTAVQVEDRKQRIDESLKNSFIAKANTMGYSSVYISPIPSSEKSIPFVYEQKFFKEGMPGASKKALSYAGFLAVASTRVLPISLSSKIASIQTSLAAAYSERDNSDAAWLSRLSKPAEYWGLKSRMAFNHLIKNIHVSNTQQNRVLFYHSKVSHPHWNFKEDGTFVRGLNDGIPTSDYVVDLSANLLAKLRKIGAYDNSLIIFTSDHGVMPVRDTSMGGLFKGKEKLNLFYNPLMLIKLPDSSEELKTNLTTVWLGDIYPTVMSTLGVPDSSQDNQALMGQTDLSRQLRIPLFVRPSDLEGGYHSALKNYTKVEASGTFTDYGLMGVKASQ